MKITIFTGEPNTGKTRAAQLIAKFIKGNTFWINGLEVIDKKGSFKGDFLFGEMMDDTELVVFDDCPGNLGLDQFYSMVSKDGFEIVRRKRGHQPDTIKVEKIIITTNAIAPELENDPYFNRRFEIINF